MTPPDDAYAVATTPAASAQRRTGSTATWSRLLERPRERAAADLALLAVAIVVALAGASHAGVAHASLWPAAAMAALAVSILHSRGAYGRRYGVTALDALRDVAIAVTYATTAAISVAVLVEGDAAVAFALLRVWLFALLLLGEAHVLATFAVRTGRRSGVLRQPTLIVGAGEVGQRVAARLTECPDWGLEPIGFVDSDGCDVHADQVLPLLGSVEDVDAVIERTGVTHVLIAFGPNADSAVVPAVRRCLRAGLEVAVVPRMFDALNEHARLETFRGLPVQVLREPNPRDWRFVTKHAIDRLAASAAVILAAPLLGVIAALVRVSSPGPVLFRQRRVGRDGREFDLLKFRTMRAAAPGGGFAPPDGMAPGGPEGADRVTGVGRWLRRTCLDELPQLLNVARGEMSLVGPRPERPEFVARFVDDVDRYGDRHRVKSGMTGWAQVHGLRGQTSLADRIELDNFYIENWSPWLDVKTLILTVGEVLRLRDDQPPAGSANTNGGTP